MIYAIRLAFFSMRLTVIFAEYFTVSLRNESHMAYLLHFPACPFVADGRFHELPITRFGNMGEPLLSSAPHGFTPRSRYKPSSATAATPSRLPASQRFAAGPFTFSVFELGFRLSQLSASLLHRHCFMLIFSARIGRIYYFI